MALDFSFATMENTVLRKEYLWAALSRNPYILICQVKTIKYI